MQRKFANRNISIPTDLFFRIWIGRREEPEEQAGLPVRSIRQEACITFADIKWDLGEVRPIDQVF
jgi:hypothetical protein